MTQNNKSNNALLPPSYTSTIQRDFIKIYFYFKSLTHKLSSYTPEDHEAYLHQVALFGISDSSLSVNTLHQVLNAYPSDNKYPSNRRGVQDAILTSIPSYITHPPPINIKGVYYDFNIGNYQPETKYSSYLENFKVDFEDVIGQASKINADENIKHGKSQSFVDCLKPRSHSPLQSLHLACYTYRCDLCFKGPSNNPNFLTCICFTRSPSIITALRLCDPNKGIPFLYRAKYGKTVKNPAYAYISSLTPCLFMALLELSTRTGFGVINQAIECHTTNAWLRFCETSLFGRAMEYKSLAADLTDLITHSTTMNSFTMSQSGQIDGIRVIPPDHSEIDTSVIAKFEKVFPSTLDFFAINGDVGDDNARWIISSLQYLSNLPMVISTPPVLSLRYSGQATAGSGPAKISYVKDYAIINEHVKIPFNYEYVNPVIESIAENLYKRIEDNPPDLTNLESRFLELATTNSAGLTKEALADAKKLKAQEWGSEIDDFMDLANMRLIDVIGHMNRTFTTVDAYTGTLLYGQQNTVVGSRKQISRRGRTIFVVPTPLMLAGFVKLQVLEPMIKANPETASAKTSGDLRDANFVLNATGSSKTITYSSDVAGMDTSTFLSCTRLVESVVLRYLKKFRMINYPCFINKDPRGYTGYVNITIVDSNGHKRTEDVSVLEYILILGMTHPNFPTKLRDGAFLPMAMASILTFFSGRFDTSAQHTALGAAINDTIRQILMKEFTYVTIDLVFRVMGDDHVNRLTSPTVAALPKCSEAFDKVSMDVWESLGYEIEPLKSKVSAEFLKLHAVYGAIDPYHYRVPIFSSEKGETYSRSVFMRLSDFTGTIGQLSGRCSNPDHSYPLKFVGACLLGVIKVKYDTRTMVLHNDNYRSAKNKHKFRAAPKVNPSYLKDVTLSFTNGNYVTNVILLPSLWFCAPFCDISLPNLSLHFPEGIRTIITGGSFLSFRSPAMFRDILIAIQDKPHTSSKELLSDMSFDSFLSMAKDSSNPNSIGLLRWMRYYGDANAFQILRNSNIPLFNDISSSINMGVLSKLGINYAYYLFDSLKPELIDIDKEKNPKLDRWIHGIDRYLDPQKRMASYSANLLLSNTVRERVPDSMVYYYRLSSRVKSAIGQRREEVFLLKAQYELLFNKYRDVIHPKLRSDLSYGDYYVIYKPRPLENIRYVDFFKTGYGSAVPPGSLQSIFMNELGTPPLDRESSQAIKEALNKELIVAGVQEDVLKVCARIYAIGGDKALNLAFTAIQAPKPAQKKIKDMITNLGSHTFTMPYTLSPPKNFFYNMNIPEMTSSAFSKYAITNTKVEYGIWLSHIAHNPSDLSQTTSIVLGPWVIGLLGLRM